MDIETRYAHVNGVRIAYERYGSGTPLLLLHGYPETRRMWRVAAGALTERFDVVNMDLRGYGESERPDDPDGYDKRTTGGDALALARSLGWERFLVAGHDRGGRAARRLAADHPEALIGASLLDILPMEYAFNQGKDGFARHYWHWYFFLQRGLPERLMEQDPRGFFEQLVLSSSYALDPENVAHYVESLSLPGSVLAVLSDYRTAFEVDRLRWEEDAAAGRKIAVPIQVLWGELGSLNEERVLDLWRDVAEDVRGSVVLGSDHHIPEEKPQDVVRLLKEFADELGLP